MTKVKTKHVKTSTNGSHTEISSKALCLVKLHVKTSLGTAKWHLTGTCSLYLFQYFFLLFSFFIWRDKKKTWARLFKWRLDDFHFSCRPFQFGFLVYRFCSPVLMPANLKLHRTLSMNSNTFPDKRNLENLNLNVRTKRPRTGR